MFIGKHPGVKDPAALANKRGLRIARSAGVEQFKFCKPFPGDLLKFNLTIMEGDRNQIILLQLVATGQFETASECVDGTFLQGHTGSHLMPAKSTQLPGTILQTTMEMKSLDRTG